MPDQYAHVGLTTDQVAEQTGATYRQLDHWCRAGYLGVGNPGSGHRRDWGRTEIELAAGMVRPVRAGLKPVAAARVVRGETELAPGVHVDVAHG